MLKRLAPSIRRRIARLLWPNGRGIVRRDGVLYFVNLQSRNWYDKHIVQLGADEPEQRAYFLDQIRRRQSDTFLDIGANFGTYTACVALQTNCGSVFAYEPDKRSYDWLRTHLFINGLADKVQTRMVAVSNHNGTVPFALAPSNKDYLSKIGDDGSGFSVPAVRLDDEFALAGHRIAFKIDVEGHELAVLEGMKSLLRANDCFLQVECWSGNESAFIAAMNTESYHLLHRIAADHYFAKESR
ncbi:MAG: FkbM family methyltransferase [Xanthobacteraceae bacterium]